VLQFSSPMFAILSLFLVAAVVTGDEPGAAAPTSAASAPAHDAGEIGGGSIAPGAPPADENVTAQMAKARAKVARKNVAELILTFDDGPHLTNTPKLLDTLDKYGVHTVFFVNGWHFQGHNKTDEREREIMRDAVRRGHMIGNHTVHHYFLCGKVYIKRAEAEYLDNAKLIEQAVGFRPPLTRTPYGSHCRELNAILARLGIDPIGWDIDPQDWKVKNTQKVVAFVEKTLKTMRGRQILLLHDVHATTVDAVPIILEWIKDENARRIGTNEPQIKLLDYTYLMPKVPIVPPVLGSLGNVMKIWWPGIAFGLHAVTALPKVHDAGVTQPGVTVDSGQ
jgi:peptidoglycan/xylan/chitin deacetylase (PgdA/CDA1 family)